MLSDYERCKYLEIEIDINISKIGKYISEYEHKFANQEEYEKFKNLIIEEIELYKKIHFSDDLEKKKDKAIEILNILLNEIKQQND